MTQTNLRAPDRRRAVEDLEREALVRQVQTWVRKEFGGCRCSRAAAARGHDRDCPWRSSNPRRVDALLAMIDTGEPHRARREQDLAEANHRLRARVEVFEGIARAVELSRAVVLEPVDAAGAPNAGRPFHVLASSDGWGGLFHVHDELVADVDGLPAPVLRWDLPLLRADALLTALTALDAIGDVMAAHNGEGPNGWSDEISALREALDYVVRTGRATRTPEGWLALPPDEGDPGL